MQISTRQSDASTIVDIEGDITLRNTPEVRKVLLAQFQEKRALRVVVNMEKVRYIDSAGVASLVEALRISRDTKRGFALYGLSRIARQVLELTRLTQIFEIYDNEQAALQSSGTAGV